MEGGRARLEALLLLLVAFVLPLPAAAERMSQDEFELRAFIRIDQKEFEPQSRSIQSLVTCLKSWKPGDGRPENEVTVKRSGWDTFTVQTRLRSSAIFHFQSLRDHGDPIAKLVRVEYVVQGGYQQITDAETKRVILHAVCER